MIDMMKSIKQVKDESVPSAVDSAEAYPYGLCFTVDAESFEKLGLKDVPKVGDLFEMSAGVFVKSTYMRPSASGKKDVSIEFQIKEMELKQTKSKSTEDMLYESQQDEAGEE